MNVDEMNDLAVEGDGDNIESFEIEAGLVDFDP